jgi:hypothetical protein
MKKIMAVLSVMLFMGSIGMVSGCATIQGWLGKTVCSPTADQVVSYTQQIADASDSLVYFQGLVPTVPIAAIIAGLKLAIQVLSDARDGICKDATQLAAAQDQINTSKTLTMQLKAGKKIMLVR